jgi:hypothetical protein
VNYPREEILPALVLDAISTDSEDFEMISSEVSKWGFERQETFSTEEIADCLLSLLDKGFAKATPSDFITSSNRRLRMAQEDVYFKITDQGRTENSKLLKSQ